MQLKIETDKIENRTVSVRNSFYGHDEHQFHVFFTFEVIDISNMWH